MVERRLQTLIKCHSSATRFVSHPPLNRLARIVAARKCALRALRHACVRVRITSRGGVEKRIYRSRRDKRLDLSPKIRVESRVAIKALAARLSVFPTCSTLLSLLSLSLLSLPSFPLSLSVIVSPFPVSLPVIRCCCRRDVAVLISTGLACLHVLSISVFLFFRKIVEQKLREETGAFDILSDWLLACFVINFREL